MKRLTLIIVAVLLVLVTSIGASNSFGPTLRDFDSTTELAQWLEMDDTDRHIYLKANSEGIVSFKGVCEEYAIQLMDRALADGFKMSFYIMDRLEYYNHSGKWLEKGSLHAMNLVIIGESVYLIEPQDDSFWVVAYLD